MTPKVMTEVQKCSLPPLSTRVLLPSLPLLVVIVVFVPIFFVKKHTHSPGAVGAHTTFFFFN